MYSRKANKVKTSTLNDILSLEQTIHNLKVRFPIGMRKIDDEYDQRLKNLELLLILKLTKTGLIYSKRYLKYNQKLELT